MFLLYIVCNLCSHGCVNFRTPMNWWNSWHIHVVALIARRWIDETNDCVFSSLMQFRRFGFLSYQKTGFDACGQHILMVEEKFYFELIFCFYVNRSCGWGYCWNSCWNSCRSFIGSWCIFWILPKEEDTERELSFTRFHFTFPSGWEGYVYFFL